MVVKGGTLPAAVAIWPRSGSSFAELGRKEGAEVSVLLALIPGAIGLAFFCLSYRDTVAATVDTAPDSWQWRFLAPAIAAAAAPLSAAAQQSAAGDIWWPLLLPVLLIFGYTILVVGVFRGSDFDKLFRRLHAGIVTWRDARVHHVVFAVGIVTIACSATVTVMNARRP
jgi:hypothetical protein